MRASLTIPGTIIGVASVIILVSLVNACMSYMTESSASPGTSQATVNMIDMSSHSVSVDEMCEFLEENTSTFNHMTSQVTVPVAVKHGNDAMSSTSVTGVSEDCLSIKDYQLQEGRSIQYFNIVSRQKVCIIGYYVATGLYEDPEKAIDQTIKIDGYAHQVVGVVKRQNEESRKDGEADDFF